MHDEVMHADTCRESAFAWCPDDSVRSTAQLTRFLARTGFDSFEQMYRWSVEDVPGFTDQLLQFLDIQFSRPYTSVVDLSRGPEWPVWCVGASLNISLSCVDRHVHAGNGGRLAVVWEGEEAQTRSLTYAALRDEVQRCSAGLRSIGLRKGDAVGVQLPMMPETVVALLALARMGAVAVPLFTGYGPGSIEARLRDVRAKALIVCDAYPRAGSLVGAVQLASEAAERCPELKHIIVVPRSHIDQTPFIKWHELLSAGDDDSVEPTGAEDPLIVIYTSGTTGPPKGIVHSHCGFPVKSAQDMCFGMDTGAGTRISWITDIGWMMGPWLIYGATILGATMVLYDGSPFHPSHTRLWEFCARHNVEVLGISPTLVRTLAAKGDAAKPLAPLDALRILASTGEPWNPEPWWWLFENVGRSRLPIINYSGGTEISGGILLSNPLLPIKPCAFSAPCPGIAADVVDEDGKSVAGSVGELVIRQPWIGMARGFLNDPGRYLETYWSRWPGLWTHGDWAMTDPDGQWYILGRSDDTLKIAGKRVGPAEVESVLVGHSAVAESAVVGVPHDVKGTAMVAFCVLKPGHSFSPQLEAELRDRAATELGKPLRPEAIHCVEALPKTRNAKVMRRVLRAAYLGENPGDLTALENPQIIEIIRGIRKHGGAA